MSRAHYERGLEGQSDHVAPPNLRHLNYVRILCGTLDKLPEALAQLDGQPCTGPSSMERKNRDEEPYPSGDRPGGPPDHPGAHLELQVSS